MKPWFVEFLERTEIFTSLAHCLMLARLASGYLYTAIKHLERVRAAWRS